MAQFKPDFEPGGRATYERAQRGYDAEHERALLEAITEAIFETSTSERRQCGRAQNRRSHSGPADGAGVRPRNVAVGDALAHGHPQDVDDLGKRLRRRVCAAEQTADLQDFVRRSFWNGDEGGNA